MTKRYGIGGEFGFGALSCTDYIDRNIGLNQVFKAPFRVTC